jgi:organic radical activating enzyme
MTYNGENIVSCGIKNYNFKTFTWKLIDVCNQQCSYCNEGFGSEQFRPKSSFFKDEKQLTSYKNVLKILKLRSIGKFEVDIIGGEPTLHPNIYDILFNINSIENCKEISLLTNFKKPLSFFEKFNDEKYNKLLFCPSIHFEYYTPELLDKCIKINNFKYTKIIPIVMLHDNPKYWDNMEIFINGLIEYNVEYTISFINSCYDYIVNYTPEFYSRFNKFFTYDDNKYLFNDKLLLDKYDIHSNQLMNFTGWRCKPRRYVIKHTGEISNACTGKSLSFINNDSFITCGVDKCGCDIQWNYEKYKP